MMSVPIVVCNFNRLACLRRQMECFDRRGWGGDVTILDMSSDWLPLLEWYKTCGRRVVTLPNGGPHHWWSTPEYQRVKGGYYVYTDSDVVLADTCPENVLEYFVAVLKETAGLGFGKIGPILRTWDLPDYFPLKNRVLELEAFISDKVKFPYVGNGVRVSLVDTTFALYAPGVEFSNASPRSEVSMCFALRADVPYEAVHLPWYMDFRKLTDEDRHYFATIRSEGYSSMSDVMRMARGKTHAAG